MVQGNTKMSKLKLKFLSSNVSRSIAILYLVKPIQVMEAKTSSLAYYEVFVF